MNILRTRYISANPAESNCSNRVYTSLYCAHHAYLPADKHKWIYELYTICLYTSVFFLGVPGYASRSDEFWSLMRFFLSGNQLRNILDTLYDHLVFSFVIVFTAYANFPLKLSNKLDLIGHYVMHAAFTSRMNIACFSTKLSLRFICPALSVPSLLNL